MKLDQAIEIAERIRAELAPFCERVEIAGSIRRRKPEIGDIEIVAIPRMVESGFLWSNPEIHLGFCIAVARYQAVKGKPTGKYTQRLLPGGIKLDLFMARQENWGLIFAIRTGSAKFAHRVVAGGWCRAGYHSVDGMLVKGLRKIPVCEERYLFNLIDLPWSEPWERNL